MKIFSLTLIGLLFCTATLSAQTGPAVENEPLRIMSYNTHNCIGMDKVTSYDRIADVISSADPDVVALQELDSMTTRNNDYVLGELARRTLMHATYNASIEHGGGSYGIGVLSKEKPLGVRRIPLPGTEEPRSLLIVEFEKYVVCCTHFSLTEQDRVASARIILDTVRGLSKPVFLAGDMNDVEGSRMQNLLTEKFTVLNDPEQITIGGDENGKCIDFIYGYNNGALYSVLGRRVMDEKVASDHRPLFVDVKLAVDEADIFRTVPFLQNPTGGGVTVTWLTNVPVHSWVEYGTDGKQWDKAETLVDGQVVCFNKIHKVRLNDLEPGKKYYYRVVSREMTLYEGYKKEFGRTARSETYSFALPAADQGDFTALVFDDLHKNKALMDALVPQFEGVEYDFVFFNGDIVDDPRNEAAAVDFISYINERVDAAQHPVIFLRGNHEIRNAYSIGLRGLLDYVGDKTYGAFNWGDTRFVMLDCGEDKPDSTPVYYELNDFTQLRLDQVDFLREELRSPEFRKAKKRVLIHHIPVYGLGDGYNPCLELWQPLLESAPFDININGHTHRPVVHPKGSIGNNFPVVIGGGSSVEAGAVMILQKEGDDLRLKMISTSGKLMHEVAN